MQQMKKLYLAFILTLGSMVLALVNLFPFWAPEAAWIANGIAIGASLVAAGGIGWMVWLIRAGISGQSKPTRSFIPSMVLAMMLGCGLVFLVMMEVFFISGGFFSAKFHASQEYPEHQVTLYIYDNSFMDSRTLLRVRRGWMPFMEPVTEYPVAPEEFVVEKEGEWVSFPGGRYHLPTGELEPDPMDGNSYIQD